MPVFMSMFRFNNLFLLIGTALLFFWPPVKLQTLFAQLFNDSNSLKVSEFLVAKRKSQLFERQSLSFDDVKR